MIYTQEVENMCPVAQGVHHGAAPVPTEGKWVQNITRERCLMKHSRKIYRIFEIPG